MDFGTFRTLKGYHRPTHKSLVSREYWNSNDADTIHDLACTKSRQKLTRAVRARSRAAHGNSRASPSPAGPSRAGQHTLIQRNQCHRTPGELNKVSECCKKHRPGCKFRSKHIIQFTAGVRFVDCAAPTFKTARLLRSYSTALRPAWGGGSWAFSFFSKLLTYFGVANAWK